MIIGWKLGAEVSTRISSEWRGKEMFPCVPRFHFFILRLYPCWAGVLFATLIWGMIRLGGRRLLVGLCSGGILLMLLCESCGHLFVLVRL